ncbi:carbonic anhydrase [Marinomonas agarivorans]|nr:carbonic anhydrase [Marinomonas agarivorans]
MAKLDHLFQNNKDWAQSIVKKQPDFFTLLAKQQQPEYLWIGCADSRVPANEIINLLPGEVFVHRNIANMVVHSDLNCLSVIQYAVEVLKVKHIMVVGHYGCGGINAALTSQLARLDKVQTRSAKANSAQVDNSQINGGEKKVNIGLVENWLNHIKDVYRVHQDELQRINDPVKKSDRLCELNVIEQVANVCQTTIVQEAWQKGQELQIHGWIYSIKNGLIKDLNVTAPSLE